MRSPILNLPDPDASERAAQIKKLRKLSHDELLQELVAEQDLRERLEAENRRLEGDRDLWRWVTCAAAVIWILQGIGWLAS